jgi:RNA polymerase sigma factor for flagellar operon FliA
MIQAQSSAALKSTRNQETLDVNEVAELCKNNPTKVAEMYAPLIWKVIGRMARRLPPYVQAEDLYGVGALGLIDAVDKFDATKSTGFASYAEYRIRGAILDELRHRDPMPRVLRGRFKEVARKLEALSHELGREPTEVEAAKAAGMSLKRYQEFRLQVERATTISYNDALAGYYTDGPASNGPNNRVPQANSAFNPDDVDGPEEYEAFRLLLRQEKMDLIAERVSRLEERDQIIMALHYQEGLNFRQIGEVLGLTESRISQIHKAIIQALRSQLQDIDD